MRVHLVALLVSLASAKLQFPSKLYYCKHTNAPANTQGVCVQIPLGAPAKELATGTSLLICQANCGQGNLWPKPQNVTTGQTFSTIDRCSISFGFIEGKQWPAPVVALLKTARTTFYDTLDQVMGQEEQCKTDGSQVIEPGSDAVAIVVSIAQPDVVLKLETDESYSYTIKSQACACKNPTPCQHQIDNTCSPQAQLPSGAHFCWQGTFDCAIQPAILHVEINATNFFGARHAIETVSQMIAYDAKDDDPTKKILAMTNSASVTDKPKFPYRGLLIDTSRHFLPVSVLHDMIRAMGYNKLNTLHWHMSDTSSFPVEMTTHPKITETGAYGPDNYYSVAEVKALVQYATTCGVRIVPEIDSPGHAWAGWTWGPAENMGELVLCGSGWLRKKPDGEDEKIAWTNKGLEPQTGQLNIVNPNTMKVLGGIYSDLVALFKENGVDIFHLGGDEVVIGDDFDYTGSAYAGCYNSSDASTLGNPNPILEHIAAHPELFPGGRFDKMSFYKLWGNFTKEAFNMLMTAFSANGVEKPSKIMQWAGAGTGGEPTLYNIFGYPEIFLDAVPKERFLVQVWDELVAVGPDGKATPSLAKDLTHKYGYDVILSNSDYTYLDCGGSGWVKPGGYWCDKYLEWYKIHGYINSMQTILNMSESDMSHVKGSELCMWGEETDGSNIMTKVWPRAAALAESLWSGPSQTEQGGNAWFEADARMQMHRRRLQTRGIDGEAMQPLWCLQNGNSCSIDPGDKEANAKAARRQQA
jgi:hexosaminidase